MGGASSCISVRRPNGMSQSEIVGKEELNKLKTDYKDGEEKNRAIKSARIFTKKVLNVLRGKRANAKIPGWEAGQPANLELKFEVQGRGGSPRYSGRSPIKFKFSTPEKEVKGINDFLHRLDACRDEHSLDVTPKKTEAARRKTAYPPSLQPNLGR